MHNQTDKSLFWKQAIILGVTNGPEKRTNTETLDEKKKTNANEKIQTKKVIYMFSC